MKKKKIISLVLALVLVLVTAIPVSAESGFYFVYENYSHYASKINDKELIETSINEIIQALKNGYLCDSNGTTIDELKVVNPILYFNGKRLADGNGNEYNGHLLSTYGIKVGDTIEVYNYAYYVNVRFEGKEYAVPINENCEVDDLKAAIANAGIINSAPSVENQLLYDNTGNLLTSGSVSSGSTVMLYNTGIEKTTITSVDDGYNDYKLPVTATYESGDGAPATYSVDVSWGTMQFTYNAPKKVWDPIKHTEEDDGKGTFSCVSGANQITVANHSNMSVKVKFEFNVNDTYGAINGEFTGMQKNVTGDVSSIDTTTGWSNVESDLKSEGVTLAVGTVDPSGNQIVTDVVVATLALNGKLSDPGNTESTVIGTVTIGLATDQ